MLRTHNRPPTGLRAVERVALMARVLCLCTPMCLATLRAHELAIGWDDGFAYARQTDTSSARARCRARTRRRARARRRRKPASKSDDGEPEPESLTRRRSA